MPHFGEHLGRIDQAMLRPGKRRNVRLLRETFRGGFFVEQRSDQSVFLDLEYLDPDVMKMQFQMSSMGTVGDPIMYFTMYPGRFASAHLQGVNTTAGMNPVGTFWYA